MCTYIQLCEMFNKKQYFYMATCMTLMWTIVEEACHRNLLMMMHSEENLKSWRKGKHWGKSF